MRLRLLEVAADGRRQPDDVRHGRVGQRDVRHRVDDACGARSRTPCGGRRDPIGLHVAVGDVSALGRALQELRKLEVRVDAAAAGPGVAALNTVQPSPLRGRAARWPWPAPGAARSPTRSTVTPRRTRESPDRWAGGRLPRPQCLPKLEVRLDVPRRLLEAARQRRLVERGLLIEFAQVDARREVALDRADLGEDERRAALRQQPRHPSVGVDPISRSRSGRNLASQASSLALADLAAVEHELPHDGAVALARLEALRVGREDSRGPRPRGARSRSSRPTRSHARPCRRP